MPLLEFQFAIAMRISLTDNCKFLQFLQIPRLPKFVFSVFMKRLLPHPVAGYSSIDSGTVFTFLTWVPFISSALAVSPLMVLSKIC